MTDLEKRYGKVLVKIRSKVSLLNLPNKVKEILKNVTDLETKTKMLEEIANRL